jgi:hypothetical protein
VILKVSNENNRNRSRIRFWIRQSRDADPDPYQNVTDPQHCKKVNILRNGSFLVKDIQLQYILLFNLLIIRFPLFSCNKQPFSWILTRWGVRLFVWFGLEEVLTDYLGCPEEVAPVNLRGLRLYGTSRRQRFLSSVKDTVPNVSVANPGCWSRIRIQGQKDSGSRIRIFI